MSGDTQAYPFIVSKGDFTANGVVTVPVAPGYYVPVSMSLIQTSAGGVTADQQIMSFGMDDITFANGVMPPIWTPDNQSAAFEYASQGALVPGTKFSIGTAGFAPGDFGFAISTMEFGSADPSTLGIELDDVTGASFDLSCFAVPPQ